MYRNTEIKKIALDSIQAMYLFYIHLENFINFTILIDPFAFFCHI